MTGAAGWGHLVYVEVVVEVYWLFLVFSILTVVGWMSDRLLHM